MTKENSGKCIKFTDKLFLISIFVIFISCLVIIVLSIGGGGSAPAKSVNNNQPTHWEYKTLTVEYEEECDFSKMLDDKWQLTGIQIKEYETNLKFRKNTN